MILWKRIDGTGLERCVIEATGDGHRVAGTVLLSEREGPVEIRYTILLDPAWQTKTVGAHVQGPGSDRRLALNTDGSSHWATGADPILDLYGAVDVSLSWTPATAMIAIRRLDLAEGEQAETAAVRIDYPGRDIRRIAPRYARATANDYRFESGGVTVDVVTDDEGVVIDHGGHWVAEA